MGRGNHKQKAIDARKEKRAGAPKSPSTFSSPSNKKAGGKSKTMLRREYKANKSVSESFRKTSIIHMDRKEENMIIDMLAMLDNVELLAPQKVVKFSKSNTVIEIERAVKEGYSMDYEVMDRSLRSSSSDDDDDEDEEDDDEGEEEEGDDELLQATIANSNLNESSSVKVNAVEDETCEVLLNENDSEPDEDSSSSSASASANASENNSDDSGDGDSDSNSDSDESTGTLKQPTTSMDVLTPSTVEGGVTPIGRNKYIRQLIRNDRRYRRELALVHATVPSVERVVSRIKQSLKKGGEGTGDSNAASANPSSSSSSSSSSAAAPAAATTLSSTATDGTLTHCFKSKQHPQATSSFTPSSSVKAAPTLGSSVRVSAYFDKNGDGTSAGTKKTGPAKLLVVARTLSVPELVQLVRGKFNVKTPTGGGAQQVKHNALLVVKSGELVDDFTLMTLPDTSEIVLCSVRFASNRSQSLPPPPSSSFSPVETPAPSSIIDNNGTSSTATTTLSDTATVVRSIDKLRFEEEAHPRQQEQQEQQKSPSDIDEVPLALAAKEAVPDVKPSYWVPPAQQQKQNIKLNNGQASVAEVLDFCYTPSDMPVGDSVVESADANIAEETSAEEWTSNIGSGEDHQKDPAAAVLSSNQETKETLTALYRSDKYAPIRESRKALPIFKSKEELLSAISNNQTIVVSGETGSGKTTQLPLYLLEQAIKAEQGNETLIICTQPRRIAAISVAERVHYEAAQTCYGKAITSVLFCDRVF
jgi:hypothetical protein